jgi:hypothetical protein
MPGDPTLCRSKRHVAWDRPSARSEACGVKQRRSGCHDNYCRRLANLRLSRQSARQRRLQRRKQLGRPIARIV